MINHRHCGLQSRGSQVDAPSHAPAQAAKVQLVEPTGSETQVLARIGETALTCAFRERVSAGPGDTIHIAPDLSLVHLFDGTNGQRVGA